MPTDTNEGQARVHSGFLRFAVSGRGPRQRCGHAQRAWHLAAAVRAARCVLTIVIAMLVLPTGIAATAESKVQPPGTIRLHWTLVWPQAGQKRVFLNKFQARGGLIKTVRVLIDGSAVAGPPNLSVVACRRTRDHAAAEKAWVWDGHNVYISLLLDPGKCNVAGTAAHITVILRTVGT